MLFYRAGIQLHRVRHRGQFHDVIFDTVQLYGHNYTRTGESNSFITIHVRCEKKMFINV